MVVHSFLERDWTPVRAALLPPVFVIESLLRTVTQPVILLKGWLACASLFHLFLQATQNHFLPVQGCPSRMQLFCDTASFLAGDGEALMQQTERLVSHYMASASSDT